MARLIYILHSGNLYGTERMALATMQGLAKDYEPVLFAPSGPVHAEARRHGIEAHHVARLTSLAADLSRVLCDARRAVIVATGVSHSLLGWTLGTSLSVNCRHLHVVHGGTEERLSYGRKRLLASLPVTLVAVSDFVRERLLAHGCRESRVSVVENFLPATVSGRRAAFAQPGVRRVAVISRLDPIKRVGMLLDAIELRPELANLKFEIFGSGEQAQSLRARAGRHANVTLHGFVPDVAGRLPDFDLLAHTCAEEPFGLSILEAMAAGLPVLVPNAGGAGSLVTAGESGFHFAANDPMALGSTLARLIDAPAATLNGVRAAADAALAGRFSAPGQLARYRQLMEAA